jgi:hypothetical protein
MKTTRLAPGIKHRTRLLVGIIALMALLLPALPAKAIWNSSEIKPSGKYPSVGAAWSRTNCCLEIGEADDEHNYPVDPGDYNFAMPNPPLYPFFDADFDGDSDQEFLEGPKVRVNGILIAPNVMLTQGDYFRNGRHLGVSFREQLVNEHLTLNPKKPYPAPQGGFTPPNIVINVGADGKVGSLPNQFIIDPHNVAKFDVGAPGVYEGYGYRMPGLTEEDDGFVTNDLAVIILAKNVKGAPLAKLPALGSLATKTPSRLTAISYGPQGEEPDLAQDKDDPLVEDILSTYTNWDFQQRQSRWNVSSVDDARLRLEAPQPSYYCDADEGAPFINDKTGEVAGLMTFWSDYCNDTVAYATRLDTPAVYSFLCDLSKGNSSLAPVPDPNPAPGQLYLNDDTDVQPKGNVHYPEITRQSRSALQRYCGPHSPWDDHDALSADAGSQPSADQPQSETPSANLSQPSPHKHKSGGKHRGKGKHRK